MNFIRAVLYWIFVVPWFGILAWAAIFLTAIVLGVAGFIGVALPVVIVIFAYMWLMGLDRL